MPHFGLSASKTSAGKRSLRAVTDDGPGADQEMHPDEDPSSRPDTNGPMLNTGDIERTVSEVAGELGSAAPVSASVLASLRGLASSQAARMHEEVRARAGTDMDIEDRQRAIASIGPALVVMELAKSVVGDFSLESLLSLDVLPRWVVAEASALRDAYGLDKSVIISPERARATISASATAGEVGVVVGVVAAALRRAGSSRDSRDFGGHGDTGALTFAALLVLAASVFMHAGDVKSYQTIAREFSLLSHQVETASELLGMVALTLESRLRNL